MSDGQRGAYDGRYTVWVLRHGLRLYLHLDHVIPLCDGGALTDAHNLQTLCESCNSAKSGGQYGTTA